MNPSEARPEQAHRHNDPDPVDRMTAGVAGAFHSAPQFAGHKFSAEQRFSTTVRRLFQN